MQRRISVNTFTKKTVALFFAILFLIMLPVTGMSARIEMNEIVEEQLVDLTKYINDLVCLMGRYQ